ncbi:MAG: hypothetical protein Q8R37_02240 [Nanoarchaeota archaeon]|nr:hypothetical protein [Nanoarchaeota archaeon]
MSIYETTVPAGTYYKKQDLEGTVLDLEPLTKIMCLSYYSPSKNREISIEVDLSKKELKADSGELPYEFPIIIKSMHKVVVASAHKYEHEWGLHTYTKIVTFLEHANNILPQEPLEDETNSYFLFNPDYTLSLEGHLNDENDDYYAECKPITLWTSDHRNKPIAISIEKSLYLYTEGETITAEHSYFFPGEQEARYSHSIRDLPNDGKKLKRILEEYKQKIEESLLEVLLLKE